METLDPTIFALTKAIKYSETGGGNTYTATGQSGEFGAYQFMPSTYKLYAKKYLGDENAQPSMENQNKIAYSFVKEKKESGFNPAQIASMWNAGEGRPNAYRENWRGTNSKGVSYDTPAYAAKVSKYYQQFKIGEVEEVQPVQPNQGQQQTDKGFLGNLAAGILKTPARLATNLINAKQIAFNEPETQPFSGDFLGEVTRVGNTGRGFGADVLESFGAGTELASFIPIVRGTSLGYQGLKTLAKGGAKEFVKKSTIPLVKEGAAGGFLGTTGIELQKTAETGEAPSLGNIALGTATGAVAAPILGTSLPIVGGAIRSTGKGIINKIAPTPEYLTGKLDSNIRNMYKNMTGDVGKINEMGFKAKKGIELLNKESPNIQIPDNKAPLGLNANKTFDIQKATPNELLSGVIEMDKRIARIARSSAEEASQAGAKINTTEAQNIIYKAIDSGEITKGAGKGILKQIENTKNDPLKIHNWVQDVNIKFGKKFQAGTIDDTATSKIANDVASIFRKNLDTIYDRKGYAEAFGNNRELWRILVSEAKKANKGVDWGDIMTDAGLDAGISAIAGNPAYMARTVASGAFRALTGGFKRGTGIRSFKKAADISGKLGTETRLPTSGIKGRNKEPQRINLLPAPIKQSGIKKTGDINILQSYGGTIQLGRQNIPVNKLFNDFIQNLQIAKNRLRLPAPTPRTIVPNTQGTPNQGVVYPGNPSVGGLRQRYPAFETKEQFALRYPAFETKNLNTKTNTNISKNSTIKKSVPLLPKKVKKK